MDALKLNPRPYFSPKLNTLIRPFVVLPSDSHYYHSVNSYMLLSFNVEHRNFVQYFYVYCTETGLP